MCLNLCSCHHFDFKYFFNGHLKIWYGTLLRAIIATLSTFISAEDTALAYAIIRLLEYPIHTKTDPLVTLFCIAQTLST